MEFQKIFGGKCGIAGVFEWNVVEYGWNERNGTTENPEQTEERQMGRAGPGGTKPYRMKMPPLPFPPPPPGLIGGNVESVERVGIAE
jgi:hypothetical protein